MVPDANSQQREYMMWGIDRENEEKYLKEEIYAAI